MERDRFRTYWIGPLDPRALNWAADHGLSYFISGGTTTRLRFGVWHMSETDPSDIDSAATLRLENDKSGDEARAHHAQDTDLDTGNARIHYPRNMQRREVYFIDFPFGVGQVNAFLGFHFVVGE